MYNALYGQFQTRLNTSDDLLIIGYSFGDEHINEVILKTVNQKKPSVININPKIDFPYVKEYVTNIKNISDLK